VWICLCEAVTSATIRDVISSGARTLEDVEAACAAGTVCGKCKRNIHLLLAEYRRNGQSSDAHEGDGVKGEVHGDEFRGG
jgi:bacterioferritin-associated ferredoxin